MNSLSFPKFLKTFRLKSLMMIAAAVAFAACTEDIDQPGAVQEGQLLQINITMADITSADPETRATDNGYNTAFALNDQIGIIVIKSGSVVAGQDNIPYKYNGSQQWEPMGSSKVYALAGATYFVYYPYSATMNGKKTVAELVSEFSVPTDQSDQTKYTKADLMTGTGAVNIGVLNVSFTHALAMVELNLPTGATTSKLTVDGGTEYTPWNITGTTHRCLVKSDTVNLSGSYYDQGRIRNWSKSGATLTAGKYEQLTMTTQRSKTELIEEAFANGTGTNPKQVIIPAMSWVNWDTEVNTAIEAGLGGGDTYALDMSAVTGTSYWTHFALTANRDKIVSLVLPNTVTLIWNNTFQEYTNITSISGAGVTTINGTVFFNLVNLTTIRFPVLTTIGVRPFSGCINLTDLYLPAVPPSIAGNNIFDNTHNGGAGTCTIHVASPGTVLDYTNAWGVAASVGVNGATSVYGNGHRGITIVAP